MKLVTDHMYFMLIVGEGMDGYCSYHVGLFPLFFVISCIQVLQVTSFLCLFVDAVKLISPFLCSG